MSYYSYNSPFEDRYRGKKTSAIFSSAYKFTTWRILWVWLAEAEQKCGLPITDTQIAQMKIKLSDIPYSRAKEIEEETRHDVVAHLKAYAEQCPDAAPIIHLGATSCYITDNADVMILRDAMNAIEASLFRVVDALSTMAINMAGVPTVGRTHFQPAQLTTVGKRAAMWAQDFLLDYNNLVLQNRRLTPLGCRGATGTADSFLKLFNGNETMVDTMEQYIVKKMGFSRAFPVSGQTYTRKQDFYILQVLSGIAQSASKFATDIRLLAGLGEVSESFGKNQVGSSAMPYKKNPIMCEKICGLSRYVIIGAQNAAITASTQWLERTLDDSSNRRLLIPEMFMATETILDTCLKVITGMSWNRDVIESHVAEQAENTMVEGVLAESVKRGGNRQELHEKLKRYTMNNKGMVAEKIADDPEFGLTYDEVCAIRDAPSTGMAEEQVRRFVCELPGQAP